MFSLEFSEDLRRAAAGATEGLLVESVRRTTSKETFMSLLVSVSVLVLVSGSEFRFDADSSVSCTCSGLRESDAAAAAVSKGTKLKLVEEASAETDSAARRKGDGESGNDTLLIVSTEHWIDACADWARAAAISTDCVDSSSE